MGITIDSVNLEYVTYVGKYSLSGCDEEITIGVTVYGRKNTKSYEFFIPENFPYGLVFMKSKTKHHKFTEALPEEFNFEVSLNEEDGNKKVTLVTKEFFNVLDGDNYYARMNNKFDITLVDRMIAEEIIRIMNELVIGLKKNAIEIVHNDEDRKVVGCKSCSSSSCLKDVELEIELFEEDDFYVSDLQEFFDNNAKLSKYQPYLYTPINDKKLFISFTNFLVPENDMYLDCGDVENENPTSTRKRKLILALMQEVIRELTNYKRAFNGV